MAKSDKCGAIGRFKLVPSLRWRFPRCQLPYLHLGWCGATIIHNDSGREITLKWPSARVVREVIKPLNDSPNPPLICRPVTQGPPAL
jgi:hypothetical protein